MLSDYADEIVPHIWLGSEDAGMLPLAELQRHGVTHVFVPAYFSRNPVVHPNELNYMHLNLRDISGISILAEFPASFTFLDDALAAGGTVLLHCSFAQIYRPLTYLNRRARCIAIRIVLLRILDVSYEVDLSRRSAASAQQTIRSEL
jgi:hypothetical protein